MNECPFCGDRLFWRIGQTTEFVCNTAITETGLAPSIGKDCLKNQLAQQTDRIEELEGLVREMGKILNAALPLTLTASDWAIRYEIDSLDDAALAVNAMFFAEDGDGIMNRTEVKKILEAK